MRNAAVVLAQVLVCLLLTGVLLPAMLATMPVLRAGRAGSLVVIACPVAIFLLLRAVWPKRRA